MASTSGHGLLVVSSNLTSTMRSLFLGYWQTFTQSPTYPNYAMFVKLWCVATATATTHGFVGLKCQIKPNTHFSLKGSWDGVSVTMIRNTSLRTTPSRAAHSTGQKGHHQWLIRPCYAPPTCTGRETKKTKSIFYTQYNV